MTLHRLSALLLLALFPLLPTSAQTSAAPQTEPDFAAMIQPVPLNAKVSDPDYYIWCGRFKNQFEERLDIRSSLKH